MKNKTREQAINYLVKEFNLLPYQEYVLRNMMTNKYCLIPPLSRNGVYINSLLAMSNLIMKGKEDKNEKSKEILRR